MSTNVSVIDRSESRSLTAAEHRAQVNLIQEVMQSVMSENVHYGTIPGTPKPSLWKPGAEKLLMTFHIAADAQIEADLSTSDVVRYRVRAVGTAASSGAFLGAALGECSSDEEKYKWRSAVCAEEFNETPADRRRRKWKRDGSSVNQVRTEPADIANTVLKMAAKRAIVGLALQITAASDIFTQDIEDLDEETREQVTAEDRPTQERPRQEQRPASNGNPISEPQRKRAFAIGQSMGWTVDQYRAVVKRHGFATDKDIAGKEAYEAIVAELQRGPNAKPQGDAPDGFQ